MRIASPDALHPPVMFGTELSTISRRVRHHAGTATESPISRAEPRNNELADPTFWTAYDYFMLEREARAARRALIFSAVIGWVRKLRGAMRAPS